MTWIKLDDGAATHPKLMALTPTERWAWIELLCYCARYRTDGNVPPNIVTACPSMSSKCLRKLVDLHLLDDLPDGSIRIHDWAEYNPKDPTAADRMRRYRDRTENAAEQGKSEPDTVTNTVTNAVTGTVTNAVTNPNATVSRAHTAARLRARTRPVPSIDAASSSVTHAAAATTNEPPIGLVLDAREAAAAAGWTDAQQRAIVTDDDAARAMALLAEAQADPSSSKPAALAWSKFSSGAMPAGDRATTAKGATGTRSARRLLPFGPCAVDGCDHRAATAAELDDHRAHVHGVGDPDPAPPPAQLLALVGGLAPAAPVPPAHVAEEA